MYIALLLQVQLACETQGIVYSRSNVRYYCNFHVARRMLFRDTKPSDKGICFKYTKFRANQARWPGDLEKIPKVELTWSMSGSNTVRITRGPRMNANDELTRFRRLTDYRRSPGAIVFLRGQRSSIWQMLCVPVCVWRDLVERSEDKRLNHRPISASDPREVWKWRVLFAHRLGGVSVTIRPWSHLTFMDNGVRM